MLLTSMDTYAGFMVALMGFDADLVAAKFKWDLNVIVIRYNYNIL